MSFQLPGCPIVMHKAAVKWFVLVIPPSITLTVWLKACSGMEKGKEGSRGEGGKEREKGTDEGKAGREKAGRGRRREKRRGRREGK